MVEMFSNICRRIWLLSSRLGVAAFLTLILLAPPVYPNGEWAATSGSGDVELSDVELSMDNPANLEVSRLSVPSIVSITGRGYDYIYFVNGSPETIRGVGYNPIYRFLNDEERARRYDRDFALMRAAGINTIAGWDRDKGYTQDKFDDLLLTKAEEYGLGVIMPFHLPPDGDYTNPEFRQRIAEDVADFVQRNKDHPAIRMWGIGNEVLVDISSIDQAPPFAEFLVELVDMVHRKDPNHPVIYREAEDVYIPVLREAIIRDGVERPWFVYGLNIYTYRISQVLAGWKSQGLDMPMLVTEFAPFGLYGEARAQGYVKMWNELRSYPSMVLGGLAYVWTTEGPEPVDRDFGLFDGNGVPVDDSFNQLAKAFLADRWRTPARVSTRPI